MNRRAIQTAIILLLAGLVAGGCTLATRPRPAMSEIKPEAGLTNMIGDAYLFDIKIEREHKKNSARLDIYRSGDSLSFFARGYLGKGVMKGLLAGDSVVVYFPTENEFYSGRLTSLVSDSCLSRAGPLTGLSGARQLPDLDTLDIERMIIDFFIKIPPEFDLSESPFYLTVLSENSRERSYRLENKNCSGGPSRARQLPGISLKYDLVAKRFILSEFEFISAGDSFKFSGQRRNVKLGTKLPLDKFTITIPQTAARIYP